MNYFVNFSNMTDRTWNMAVYQTFPESPGLDSVAWKRTTVPTHGFSGVTWDVEYNVALADYAQTTPLGVYIASQVLDTALGSEWEVEFQDEVQQLKFVGTLGSDLQDYIVIHNNSGLVANPGIGMSGYGAAYQREVLSNNAAQFKVTPVYWVGLFRNVILGEVISSNVESGPLRLEFGGGNNVANITADRKGDAMELFIEYAIKNT
jgi:hypothetical protein